MFNCIKSMLSKRLKASVTGYKNINLPTLTGMDAVRNFHAWATAR
jgi:hypothetical protein